ncbi:hypothetical protein CBER1_04257 [Cercospora berteroae]|uniref:Uncharacterized protein n=1 Tax=Cercospora berteroae TaxID=357750 RepID=A0A2S6C688_9PEZI|nr:hypothetical protein CBER1_04257 [Cercospora berteroae]
MHPSRRGKDAVLWQPKKRKTLAAHDYSDDNDAISQWGGTQVDVPQRRLADRSAPPARQEDSDSEDQDPFDDDEPSSTERARNWLDALEGPDDLTQQQRQLTQNVAYLAALAEGVPFETFNEADSDDEAVSGESADEVDDQALVEDDTAVDQAQNQAEGPVLHLSEADDSDDGLFSQRKVTSATRRKQSDQALVFHPHEADISDDDLFPQRKSPANRSDEAHVSHPDDGDSSDDGLFSQRKSARTRSKQTDKARSGNTADGPSPTNAQGSSSDASLHSTKAHSTDTAATIEIAKAKPMSAASSRTKNRPQSDQQNRVSSSKARSRFADQDEPPVQVQVSATPPRKRKEQANQAQISVNSRPSPQEEQSIPATQTQQPARDDTTPRTPTRASGPCHERFRKPWLVYRVPVNKRPKPPQFGANVQPKSTHRAPVRYEDWTTPVYHPQLCGDPQPQAQKVSIGGPEDRATPHRPSKQKAALDEVEDSAGQQLVDSPALIEDDDTRPQPAEQNSPAQDEIQDTSPARRPVPDEIEDTSSQPPRSSVPDEIEDSSSQHPAPPQQTAAAQTTTLPLYSIFLRHAPAHTQAQVQDIIKSFPFSSVDEARSRKIRIYNDEGLVALAKHTLELENEVFSVLEGATPGAVYCKGYMILVSSHPLIVNTCLKGSWTKSYKRDPALRTVLKKLRHRAEGKRHPFIYLNELCDDQGNAPTANELLRALDKAEAYIANDRDLVRRVDKWIGSLGVKAEATPNYRRYMFNSKYRPSSKRPERARTFFRNLRARIAKIPADQRDLPLEIPLVEIGYTDNIPERLDCHAKHRGSNFLMNMLEAILGLEGSRYRIHQFVIHSCVAQDQVAIAEILFTRLNEGYIGNAGGFSFYPASISVGSGYKYTAKIWEEAERWALDNMLKKETHQKEKLRRLQNLNPEDAELETELQDLLKRRAALLASSLQREADMEEPGIEDEGMDEPGMGDEGEATLELAQDEECLEEAVAPMVLSAQLARILQAMDVASKAES